jgi:ATP-binding cassette subfamily C (CFTR/MRP) protein 1
MSDTEEPLIIRQTPLALFDQEEGIFRSLCEEAGLSRQDIERIRASVGR